MPPTKSKPKRPARPEPIIARKVTPPKDEARRAPPRARPDREDRQSRQNHRDRPDHRDQRDQRDHRDRPDRRSARDSGPSGPRRDGPRPSRDAQRALGPQRKEPMRSTRERAREDEHALDFDERAQPEAATKTNRPTHGEMKYYGFHACEAVFRNRAVDIIRVYCTEERLRELGPLLRWCAEKRKAYHVVSSDDLEKIAASVHHEGVCLLAKEPARLNDTELLERVAQRSGPVALIYLDGVQNPHNIGSIVRVAAHFGTPYLLGREKQLPRLSASACRVAEGGIEQVTLVALRDPLGTIDQLRARGFKLVATSSHEGDSLYRTTLPERCILALGAELTGMSPKLIAASDLKLSIPGTGAVESLNVSVACGLLLGEYARHHGPAAWRA